MKYLDTGAEKPLTIADLYDGGWRANDRDDLKMRYDLTDDETDEICAGLESLEKLYNTDWSEDRDFLKACYGLTDNEAAEICAGLKGLDELIDMD